LVFFVLSVSRRRLFLLLRGFLGLLGSRDGDRENEAIQKES
jgi:hypothetical protein